MGMRTGRRTAMNGLHGKYMAVLYTGPAECGGNCRYCIRTPGLTHSTRENEDTALASHTSWSARRQLLQRIQDAGLSLGQGNKYELRIKGNSFTNYDPAYLEAYIKSALDLLNGEDSATFDEAFARQADAPDRCVQIVVETRPDLVTDEWSARMRRWGVTTVELGVQSLSERILCANRRGHGVEATREASRRVREHGFELGYHVMVGLIGASRSDDFKLLAEDLWQEDFYPDTLKIYPCIASPIRSHQLALYRALDRGLWHPYGDAEYRALLERALPRIPRDVHVNRVQRILESSEIQHGPRAPVDRSQFDGVSRCMWQRSVQQRGYDPDRDYSDARIDVFWRGNDFCLQALTEEDTIIGYARVRVGANRTVLRDLRVLGQPLAVSERHPIDRGTQHVGIGRKLLREAIAVSKASGATSLDVFCSAGTPRYFEGNGFNKIDDRLWRYSIAGRGES